MKGSPGVEAVMVCMFCLAGGGSAGLVKRGWQLWILPSLVQACSTLTPNEPTAEVMLAAASHREDVARDCSSVSLQAVLFIFGH